MSTFRVAHRRRFTTVDQTTINDSCLSFRSRGILIWLLDKPDDWTCNSEYLARQATEGRDAIRSALNELEEHGYLRRDRTQNAKGHWTTTWWVFEVPSDRRASEDGKPGFGDPTLGEPGDKPSTETKDCLPTRTYAHPSGERMLSEAIDEAHEHRMVLYRAQHMGVIAKLPRTHLCALAGYAHEQGISVDEFTEVIHRADPDICAYPVEFEEYLTTSLEYLAGNEEGFLATRGGFAQNGEWFVY